jgi:DNA-binding CsgD family transcriptional regulator/PAS domain-containing protein
MRGYSGLLETLYAATLDESQWRSFLAELCETTSSINAFLIRSDSAKGRQVLASGGEEPPSDFDRGYITTDPVGEAFMRQPQTGVIEVEDFLPHSQLVQTEYYKFMAAVGVTYGTLIVPKLSTRRFDLIGLWRGDGRVRLEPSSSELLHLLYPHIQNALRIYQALGTARERAHSVEAMLDTSATASLLLGPSGKLLHMNQAARTLVAEQDGIAESKGKITPTNAEHKAEFERLLALSTVADGAGGVITLQRKNGGQPLQALISPLHNNGVKLPKCALVLVTNPDDHPQFPDAMLKKLYGFTPAETDLANGFLTGLSPEAIAVVRGVSVGTVRSQIKSLLSKTNTQRQVDLVRLLYSLPRSSDRPV